VVFGKNTEEAVAAVEQNAEEKDQQDIDDRFFHVIPVCISQLRRIRRGSADGRFTSGSFSYICGYLSDIL
jgi:hypothetical protein